MTLLDRSTIVACCTPQGGTGGSLALIRISGPEAIRLADTIALLSSGKRLKDQPSHTLHHGQLRDRHDAIIDEVMCSVMYGPRTFTGEHTVEITCHNNPFIIERIITELIHAGAQQAQRGEFTQQAFLNKKLDLAQAEAIHELIHAATEQGVRASLAQLSGTLSHMMASIEQRLLVAIAWCEASFEFVDEVGDFGIAVKEQLITIIAQLDALQRAFSAQTHIKEGIRIALVGSVNAGKSSLFNALLGKERAIVTPVAGTTRDSIEAPLTRNGLFWTLIDTAGLRTTNDPIEHAGIMRSWHEAASADILLLVIDSTRQPTAEEAAAYQQLIDQNRKKIIIVDHKADQQPRVAALTEQDILVCSVSSLTSSGIPDLEEHISRKIATLLAQHTAPFLVNQRHYALSVNLMAQLERVVALCSRKEPAYELISNHLQQILETLGEVTGKTISEAALDRIFREFCIGK